MDRIQRQRSLLSGKLDKISFFWPVVAFHPFWPLAFWVFLHNRLWHDWCCSWMCSASHWCTEFPWHPFFSSPGGAAAAVLTSFWLFGCSVGSNEISKSSINWKMEAKIHKKLIDICLAFLSALHSLLNALDAVWTLAYAPNGASDTMPLLAMHHHYYQLHSAFLLPLPLVPLWLAVGMDMGCLFSLCPFLPGKWTKIIETN